MSDSIDNTNELESYGVWVKNTPQQEPEITEENFSDSLDLPEFAETDSFDDTEFSDMFNDDNQILSETNSEDTTLTDDELLNITNGTDIQIDEVPAQTDSDMNIDMPEEEPVFEDIPDGETAVDVSETEEFSFDDFNFDSPEKKDDEISLESPAIVDPSLESKDPTIEDSILEETFESEDTEINNSEISVEEVIPEENEFSIDDFGADDIASAEETVSAEESIPEDETVSEDESFPVEETSDSQESSVDIPDFDFDIPESSENTEQPVEETTEETEVAVENDFAVDTKSDDVAETEITAEETDEDEEISLDDFMDGGFSDESVASGNNGFAADEMPVSNDTEEVSLDDFVDMSEFGVSEDVPKKEDIVDEKPLEMDISFDAAADEIATEENTSVDESDYDDDNEEVYEENTVETIEFDNPTEVSSSGNDIEAEEIDLSDFGIDSEAEETPVTQDVEGSKNKEAVVDYDLSVGNDNMSSAPVVNEIKDTDSSEKVQKEETVNELYEEAEPVSDELSTVNSSLLEQIVADLSSLKDEINTLKSNLEEIKTTPLPSSDNNLLITEEDAIQDDVIVEDTQSSGGFFGADDGDDTISLSTDELSNILNTADFNEVTEENSVIDNDAEIAEQSENSESNDFINNDISYDFSEENLSEPNLDDIEIDEDSMDEDLPEEITISKDEGILVESSSSDFMDSVQDTTETQNVADNIPEAMEPEETSDSEAVSEPVDEEQFNSVDNIFEEDNSIESDLPSEIPHENLNEEPMTIPETASAQDDFENFNEAQVEEPVDSVFDEETSVPEEEVIEENIPVAPINHTNNFVENDFISHEEDNNKLTDSNIDYLTTEEEKSEVEENQPEEGDNAELKKDIKSVLLYMDQLLENLPEDKIVEFAKSEEFGTYKKLFSELGLS